MYDDFDDRQCEDVYGDDPRLDERDEYDDGECGCGDTRCGRCSDWLDDDDDDDDEGFQMSDVEADADALAGAGLGDPDDERDYIDDCNDFDDF